MKLCFCVSWSPMFDRLIVGGGIFDRFGWRHSPMDYANVATTSQV